MKRALKQFVVLAAALTAKSACACAVCYGASDAPMARGMNWGIFSLLAVVVCVLSTFATFFVFLAKKSAAVSAEVPAEPSDKTTEPL